MTEQPARWSHFLSGKNGILACTVVSALGLHALNLYISFTLMPGIVKTIGGQHYFASTESFFFIATLTGALCVRQVLACLSPRHAYALACLLFALATFASAAAPNMPVFLLARLVQGGASGLLASLSYSMVRIVFDHAFWPKAMALIASSWSIATLLGPTVSGLFGGHWRAAFLFVAVLSVGIGCISFIILPAKNSNKTATAPLPILQLLFLIASIVMISMSSAQDPLWVKIGGLLFGLALLFPIATLDKTSPSRLLPQGAFSPRSALSALYILIMLLCFPGIVSDTFVPLIMQAVHGFDEIHAGYMMVLVSVGWTIGSLASSTFKTRHISTLFKLMPVLCLTGILLVLLTAPVINAPLSFIPVMVAGLLLTGFGTGIIWPHLLTGVIEQSLPEEADLASASLTSVQLFASSLGAALAGAIVNLVGRHNTQNAGVFFQPENVQNIAIAVFVFLLFAIIATLPATWRIIRQLRAQI